MEISLTQEVTFSIDAIFFGKNWNSCFSCTSCNFLWYFFSPVLLLKNIHIHSSNLLYFVYIAVFNVETALENAILELPEL